MSYTTSDALGGLPRITDELLSTVNGAPIPIVQMAMFRALEEFCRRSLIWRQTLQVTMAPGIAIEDLNPVDDGTLAVWILRVTGFRRFETKPPAILIDLGSTAEHRAGTVLVACKPARLDNFAMPDFLASDWSQAIVDGATMHLMMTPNRPWTDRALAQFHGTRFRAAIFLAKETVRHQGDLPRAGFPYFAAGAQRGWGIPQVSGIGAPDQAPTLPESPLPLNDGDADVNGGNFTSDPQYDDVNGGTF